MAKPPPTEAPSGAPDAPSDMEAYPDNPTPADAVSAIMTCVAPFDTPTQIRILRAVCALLDIDVDFHEDIDGEDKG